MRRQQVHAALILLTLGCSSSRSDNTWPSQSSPPDIRSLDLLLVLEPGVYFRNEDGIYTGTYVPSNPQIPCTSTCGGDTYVRPYYSQYDITGYYPRFDLYLNDTRTLGLYMRTSCLTDEDPYPYQKECADSLKVVAEAPEALGVQYDASSLDYGEHSNCGFLYPLRQPILVRALAVGQSDVTVTCAYTFNGMARDGSNDSDRRNPKPTPNILHFEVVDTALDFPSFSYRYTGNATVTIRTSGQVATLPVELELQSSPVDKLSAVVLTAETIPPFAIADHIDTSYGSPDFPASAFGTFRVDTSSRFGFHLRRAIVRNGVKVSPVFGINNAARRRLPYPLGEPPTVNVLSIAPDASVDPQQMLDIRTIDGVVAPEFVDLTMGASAQAGFPPDRTTGGPDIAADIHITATRN